MAAGHGNVGQLLRVALRAEAEVMATVQELIYLQIWQELLTELPEGTGLCGPGQALQGVGISRLPCALDVGCLDLSATLTDIVRGVGGGGGGRHKVWPNCAGNQTTLAWGQLCTTANGQPASGSTMCTVRCLHSRGRGGGGGFDEIAFA